MNKINAFTLLELMIALLISSIIISIVYYCLTIFNYQWHSYQRKSQARNEFQLLYRAMQNDINNADVINDSLSNTIVVCKMYDNSVIYQSFSKITLRIKGPQTDTFLCGGIFSDVHYVSDSIRMPCSFLFNVKVNEEMIPIFFNKEYTAQQLMNFKINE